MPNEQINEDSPDWIRCHDCDEVVHCTEAKTRNGASVCALCAEGRDARRAVAA